MNLLTEEQREQLLANGRANAGRAQPHDLIPVVRLVSPWANEIWLLSELDPENPAQAYGLYDSGTGKPVLGPIDLAAVANLRGPEGQRVARDASFFPSRRLSTYAQFARVIPRTSK